MKNAEWYDVLEPREAVIAGIVGLAVVWPLTYYAYHTGYVFWGYSQMGDETAISCIDAVAALTAQVRLSACVPCPQDSRTDSKFPTSPR